MRQSLIETNVVQTKTKFPQLIVFDKRQKVSEFQRCKICINKITHQLIISASGGKSEKEIVLSFERIYFRFGNILFILESEAQFDSYILIIPKRKICEKVFNILQQGKIETAGAITKNRKTCHNLLMQTNIDKNLIDNFIKDNDTETLNNERNKTEVLKKKKIVNWDCRNSRKRKLGQSSFGKDESKNMKDKNATDIPFIRKYIAENFKDDVIIRKPRYEYFEHTAMGSTRDILLIFTSTEKKFYYKFGYTKSGKIYYCCGCASRKSHIRASVCMDKNGNEFVCVANKEHVCEPIEFLPEKIVLPPGYKVLKRQARNKLVEKLAVFNVKDPSLCFEYTWASIHKVFQCKICQHKHKTYVQATIEKDSIKGEYVKLGNNEHKCTLIKYVPENWNSKIVKHPNFLLEEIPNKKGKITKQLTVFDSADKSLFYIYTYNPDKKLFRCNLCALKRKYVTARIRNDENDVMYIELNKTEHVCEIRKKKKPLKSAAQIYCETLKNPIFASIEQTSDSVVVETEQRKKIELLLLDKIVHQGYCKLTINKLSRLLIVEPSNEECKMISASFDWQYFKHYNTLFVLADFSFKNFALVFDCDEKCKRVYNLIFKNQNVLGGNRQPLKKDVLLPIIKEITENGVSDMRIKEIAKEWIENSRNVVTTRYVKIVKHSEFALVYSLEDKIRCKRLIVFTSSEKSHCYVYRQSSSSKIFYCCGCREMNRNITVKLDKDEAGSDCIKLCKFRHVCVPKIFDEKKYYQIRILRKPEYEIFTKCFRNNQSLLIIFDPSDRGLCYEFTFCGIHGWFCSECKSVKAILRNENTENEFLELDGIAHECQKQKYDVEKYLQCKSFVVSPNFKIHTIIKFGIKRKYLIIFDENDRKLCRIYSFALNRFVCRKCENKKKKVIAKLQKNVEGEEYIILCNEKHVCELEPYRNGHICESQKYAPKRVDLIQKVNCKIIPSSLFEFQCDTKGEPNRNVIVFTSEKKDLYYRYGYKDEKVFRCAPCANRRHYVIVKVFEDENGEKFLECNSNNHVCAPTKYKSNENKNKK